MGALRFGRPTRGQVGLLALVALVTLVAAIFAVRANAPDPVPAPTSADVAVSQTPDSGLPRIVVADLPAQARETLALIDAGGPYPYRQDGTVFGNQEKLLPARPSGYYHEYTVVTPGSADRGARRLVVGTSGDTYYTADHYESFRQVTR